MAKNKLSQISNINILLFLLTFQFAFSQLGSGNIRGVVTDFSDKNLPGAYLYIEQANRTTVSGLDGSFSLVNIQAGEYNLKIKYIGYSSIEKKIIVRKGQTIDLKIVMTEDVTTLNEVTIVHNNQAKSLNIQKNKVNIANVISTDQIVKYPDANIGDAVKRISGITIQVDQGEARDVIIRGLSPQLNSVMLNGSRIPSAEGDNRNVQLDLIPTDAIQTVEVSKAITPDMDADALGGAINLITRSSPRDFQLSATLGSGVNFINGGPIRNGAFLIGNRSKNDKFGWIISSSIYDTNFGSENIEAIWDNKLSYNSGINDANGNAVLNEVSVQPYTSLLEQQIHLIQRVRRSFTANFEYQFNNNHDLEFKSVYNWRDDRERRVVLENEILGAEDIQREEFEITDGNLTRFPVEVSRQVRGGINNRRNRSARLEDQRFQNYSLSGDHIFNKIKLDWLTSFSKASEDSQDERILEYKSEYEIFSDTSDPRFPVFTPVNADEANELSSFLFEDITEENKYTEESDINFFANTEVPFSLFKERDGNIKFGVRGRFKTKLRKNDFLTFNLNNEFPTLLDVPNRDFTNNARFIGNQYSAGLFPTEEFVANVNLSNGMSIPSEFLSENFNVKENVFAYYGLTNQKITDKLAILSGLRIEHTIVKAEANDIQDEILVGKIIDKQSYVNILPSLHFKYDLSEQTILRLAWTNALSRPNYVDLAPTTELSTEDREIFLGNSELKATTSTNFDVLGEHYFKSIGILSGGFFYKRISNFIYTFRSQNTDNSFGDNTNGFTVFRPENGDIASIFGFEIALQRKLDFLPGFAKNFAIDFNYTYLTSNTEGIRDINGIERKDLDLPNTSPNLFNASLAYETKKASARISLNFSDGYLDDIGTNEFTDIYYDTQLFLDINGSYAINKNINVYIALNNVTNEPQRLFQGNASRTSELEFYGSRLTFGLKYNLF